MKKTSAAFIASVLLAISHTASAYVIQGGLYDGTNVGGEDTYIGSTGSLPNSNTDSEEDWLNGLISPDSTAFVTKTESVQTYLTDVEGILAFKLDGLPEYFIVKNARFWAAFTNINSFAWGVIDINNADIPDNMNLKDGVIISHVSEFGESENPCPSLTAPGCGPKEVPEPSSLGLVALGLIGLGPARRRAI